MLVEQAPIIRYIRVGMRDNTAKLMIAKVHDVRTTAPPGLEQHPPGGDVAQAPHEI